eukprot:m.1635258 g.1635258  ORF g.1635258 m.1635258 type:complete len:87 (-) comp25421_c1_seq1:3426-3686(-)
MTLSLCTCTCTVPNTFMSSSALGCTNTLEQYTVAQPALRMTMSLTNVAARVRCRWADALLLTRAWISLEHVNEHCQSQSDDVVLHL